MNSRAAGLAAGILMLMAVWAGEAWGQTELSGAIWGDLVAAGNPHIVVDSTWVPEGETLTLREGVELYFNEGQGLWVFGQFDASGTQESLITIGVSDSVQQWEGLHFATGLNATWECVILRCPNNAIYLASRCSFIMDNCRIQSDGLVISGDDPADPNGIYLSNCILRFINSELHGWGYILSTGSSYYGVNSLVTFGGGDSLNQVGFGGEGNQYTFDHCTIHGGLNSQNNRCMRIFRCRFLRPVTRRGMVRINASVSGDNNSYMRNTFVDGRSGAYNQAGAPVMHFENNTVMGDCGFNGYILVNQCDIRGAIGVYGETEFKNSLLSQSWSIMSPRIVSIDSCLLIHETTERNYFLHWNTGHQGVIRVTRSVIKCRLSISELGSGLFDYNTFMYDSVSDWAIQGTGQNITWINNIFVVDRPGGWLLGGSLEEGERFAYNCVSGFYGIEWGPDSLVNDDYADCVLADPKIQLFGDTPLLSFDSPCIDRGAPDAALDPDGTRSDMGAMAFYQRDAGVNTSYPVSPNQFVVSTFPSPFNSSLSISYSSPTNAPILLSLVDLSGRTLQQNWVPGTSLGRGIATIGTTALPSGNYFVIVGGMGDWAVMPVRCLK